MSNLTTMIERISDELDDDGLSDQIQRAINTAIRYYSSRRFFFTERTFTFTTVAAQESYDIDDAADIDTFLEVQDSYVTSNSIRYQVTPTDYPSLSAAQSGSATSRPTNWAFFARSFYLYPIPDAAYTVTISGHCRLVTLDDDNPTNAWMTDGEELIRQRAKRILAMDVTKEPSDAQAAQALEEMALDALDLETRLRRGRKLLRVDPALVASRPFDINVG
jgi:hypothetical protein